MGLRAATETDLPRILALHQRADYEAMIGADDAPTLRRAIEGPASQLLVWDGATWGFALLHGTDRADRRIGIFRLALERSGSGEGRPFVAAILAHAFDALAAERVWLDVAADNSRARHIYEESGLIHEGTLRAHWLRRTGDRADLAVYGILRAEHVAARTPAAAAAGAALPGNPPATLGKAR